MSKPMLFLVRGLPGSGKSTFARSKSFGCILHLEADMYFNTGKGDYAFDGSKISKAHEWCYNATEASLQSGMSVIVSNTFTQKWEMQKYLDLAEALGIEVSIHRMTGNFGNVHGTPEDVLKKMKERFEDIEGEIPTSSAQ